MQQLTEQSSLKVEKKVHMPRAVVVIGASTGGPSALTQILPKFPRDFAASIVVIQQMRPGFIGLLANQLNGLSELTIQEAAHYQQICPGTILFAPGNCAVTFTKLQENGEQSYIIKTEDISISADRLRRRIDDAMISAAEQFGTRTIGILLTGIGDDGRNGLKAIQECGGKTIAQDESSCIVYDMPRAAIEAGVVDEILPLWSITDRIIEIVGDR